MARMHQTDLHWRAYDRGDHAFRHKELSNAVDASKLGCSLYVGAPPGSREERTFEGYWEDA